MKRITCDSCGVEDKDGFKDPAVEGLTWMPVEVTVAWHSGGSTITYDLCGHCYYTLHHQFLKRMA